MNYHVRITRRSDRGSDCVELDLSEKNLLQNIVEPYKDGKKFLCGGILVDPFDIEAIQINKTSQPSSAYLPAIRARNAASSFVVIGIPDEWYVTEEGEVVTREFINAAPGAVSVSPELSTNKMNEDDQRFMLIAIQESRKSKDENDGRVHPKVAVVVVKEGEVLAAAHRGEIALGDHAEYTALERKLSSTDLNGAAIYTTLEPCTSRGHKTPCADRIVQRKIRKVVIGTLDPNPSIKGAGVYTLKQAGIEVSFAIPALETEIKTLNKPFLEDQERIASEENAGPRIRLDESEPFTTIGKASLTAGSISNSKAKLLFMNRGSLTGTLVDVEGGIVPRSNYGRISFTLDRSRFPVQVEPHSIHAQEVNFHLDSNPNCTIEDIAKEFQGQFEIKVTYKVTTKTGMEKLTGTTFVKFEL